MSNNEEVTALAVPQADDSTISFRRAQYTTTPQFSADDLSMPRLRLTQGMTAEVLAGTATPGKWVITGYDAMDAPTVIPLFVGRKRRYSLNDENRTIMCTSEDAIHGVGDPGGSCDTCPLSQWQKVDGQSKNAPPLCTFIWSYVVYIADVSTIGVVEFSRTSEPVAKMVNTFIQTKGMGGFALKLGSTKQNGKAGTYFIPQPVLAGVSPELLETAAAFIGMIGG